MFGCVIETTAGVDWFCGKTRITEVDEGDFAVPVAFPLPNLRLHMFCARRGCNVKDTYFVESKEEIVNCDRHLIDMSSVRPVRIMHRSKHQSLQLFLYQKKSGICFKFSSRDLHDTRMQSSPTQHHKGCIETVRENMQESRNLLRGSLRLKRKVQLISTT